MTWIAVIAMCLTGGCTGSPMYGTPTANPTGQIEAAAQTAVEAWAREAGLLSTDATYSLIHRDESTATVQVRFMCQECVEATSLGYEGIVALHRIGGRWQIAAPPQFGLASDYQPRLLHGHAQGVCGLAYSADGKWLASGSADADIELWDTVALQSIQSLTGARAQACGLAFAPDGKLLAAGGRDAIILWDARSGQEVRRLVGHAGVVFSVDFAPDGRTVVSGGEDGGLKLWNPQTGQELPQLCQAQSVIRTVAFSADGSRLAAGCRAGEVRGWDFLTHELVFSLSHNEAVLDLAFSGDDRWLATAGVGRTIGVWDAHTGRHHLTLSLHTDWVTGVAFSPDSRLLASSSRDGTVRLWSMATGQQLRTMRDDGLAVQSVAYAPDGAFVAAGSVDGVIRLWRVK
jgi:WD40 repeat protein